MDTYGQKQTQQKKNNIRLAGVNGIIPEYGWR